MWVNKWKYVISYRILGSIRQPFCALGLPKNTDIYIKQRTTVLSLQLKLKQLSWILKNIFLRNYFLLNMINLHIRRILKRLRECQQRFSKLLTVSCFMGRQNVEKTRKSTAFSPEPHYSQRTSTTLKSAMKN